MKLLRVRLLAIFFVPKKSINVLHQNIDGLMSKAEALTVQLEELKAKNKFVDVVAITEHNMLNSDILLLNIPNYIMAASCCRKSRRGGSAILVHKSFRFRELIDIKECSSINNVELCAVELLEHNIVILCIYRACKKLKDSVEIFFDKLEDVLSRVCFTNKKIVACGDFNINILKDNKITEAFLNILKNYNLKISLLEPTRPASGTCLDNFLHNVRGSSCEVIQLVLSDHTAQYFKCPVREFYPIKYWYSFRRDYCEENMVKFRDNMGRLSFSDIFSSICPNEAFDKFHDMFKLIYDLCFPLVKHKHSVHKKATWITKGIRTCTKRKRALLWKYRNKPCAENLNMLKNYTKRLKSIMKLTQKSRNDYTIKMATNKSKATWNILNKNTFNKPPNAYIKKVKQNNIILTNPKDIAESFNDFFINQAKPASSSNNNSIKWHNPNSMVMLPSTPDDIFKIINSLKNTYSTGFDGIATKVIKHVADIISPVLSHIMNLCIDCGIFPDKLKLTIVKPLFKKNDKQIMNNYRPVALVSIFSKIFEKYMHHSLYAYLEKYNILIEGQFGFRKNKSINNAIYNFLKTVITARDNKLSVHAMYMDLSKAFDFVDHNILIDKLEAYGVRGNVLNLNKSFITNRLQQTQITQLCPKSKTEKMYMSSFKSVGCGVPQGSIAGPLYFITYINDLPHATDHSMVLFADDSTVVFVGNKDKPVEPEITLALSKIIKWLTCNNLMINLDKTGIMTFNKYKKLTSQICYSNNYIQEITVTKFLGIYLDSNLNWNKHAESVCSKLGSYSYALYMLGKVVNQSAVLISYHAHVTSTLRYGIIFWGNCTEKHTIFKAQKKCVRSVCHLKTSATCKNHFQSLKIMTFPCLYIYEMAVFMRNNLHMFEYLKCRRHHSKICSQAHNLDLFNKSVLGMGPKIYNHLPKAVLESANVAIFKAKLSKFLINKTYYSTKEFLEDKFNNIIL